MIHDAVAEVTCDREGCCEHVFVELEWIYRTMNESSGFYDHDETKIEEKLAENHDWVICDSKHFCTAECAEG